MTKTNGGQFKKSSPVFSEKRWFSDKVHALVYDRELRLWSVKCKSPGEFPKGYWLSKFTAEVSCSACKK